MRNMVLLPLAALVAIAAGCGSKVREQAAGSVPQRDLTLVSPTPQVEVASPLETRQLRTQPRSAHHSQLAARLASVPTPASVLAVAQPAVQPAAPETPLNDRELLPGKTVTVIPVSSGPSTGTDKTDELPAERGRAMRVHGGGGTCRGGGRGPDIGMAPAPRPGFR